MNTQYATLHSYNEIMETNPFLRGQEQEQELEIENILNKDMIEPEDIPERDSCSVRVLDAALEGYHMSPEIDTVASGNVTLVADRKEKGFHVTLKVRKLTGMTGFDLYTINDEDEMGDLFLRIHEVPELEVNITKRVSGTLLGGFLGYENREKKFKKTSWRSFLLMVKKQNILAVIRTKDHPEGELTGLLKIIF